MKKDDNNGACKCNFYVFEECDKIPFMYLQIPLMKKSFAVSFFVYTVTRVCLKAVL